MEASVNRISLAASCHLNQGSCLSSKSVFLWTQLQQHCNFLRVHRVKTRIEGNLWIDSVKRISVQRKSSSNFERASLSTDPDLCYGYRGFVRDAGSFSRTPARSGCVEC